MDSPLFRSRLARVSENLPLGSFSVARWLPAKYVIGILICPSSRLAGPIRNSSSLKASFLQLVVSIRPQAFVSECLKPQELRCERISSEHNRRQPHLVASERAVDRLIAQATAKVTSSSDSTINRIMADRRFRNRFHPVNDGADRKR